MEDREWLAGLKAGDEVIVGSAHHGSLRVSSVLRTTKTQIMIDHPSTAVEYDRYRRKDGYAVGGGYGWIRSSIEKPTAKIREEIRRGNLIQKAKATRWDDYDTDSIEAALLSLRGGHS